MDLQIDRLLDELAGALRTICNDPDLCLLLFNPPVADNEILLATTPGAEIPEFADEAAATRFVASRLEGRRSPLEIRQLSSADGYSIIIEIPFALLMSVGERPHPQSERREFAPPLSASLLEGSLCVGATALTPLQTMIRLLGLDGDAGGAEEPDGLVLSLALRLLCGVFDVLRSLKDPVSQLLGRADFEGTLARSLALAGNDQQPLGVLLINPDDFVMVNHRFGRAAGDRALREIADLLSASVRESDRVFRHGGAAFGVILPATAPASTELAAGKFQRILSDASYLDGQLEKTFSVGGVVVEAADLESAKLEALDVLRRAEHALHQAKLAGDGARLLVAVEAEGDQDDAFDPHTGIFAADADRDYRNMMLLWDCVALVASTPDPETLAAAFVDRLMTRFWADRITLLSCADGHRLRPLARRQRQGLRAAEDEAEIAEPDLTLASRALARRQLEQRSEPRPGRTQVTVYALPLLLAGKRVGALLFEGCDEQLNLAATDLVFLNALTNQLAVALDRFSLAQQAMARSAAEKRALLTEVRELRHAVQHSRLIYQSPEMDALMRSLRRIAPTDATTLIIGESGTGKEMLARAVHEHSGRADGPFVTVDCSAIAHSLIDAELFGFRKGAFTGADSDSDGRILSADGGTVFLDEIGELPLDVQSKLLRFVQERELTPLGSASSVSVDARIVAATNRDLARRVAEGSFREDLFYRLQVITLEVPPLRERRDDVLPLARFFLEKFADQHMLACEGLEADAEALLLTHDWPGNVRELQHCMLRSVLMGEPGKRRLAAQDIRLASPGHDAPPAPAAPVAPGRGMLGADGGSAGDRLMDMPREEGSDVPIADALQRCLRFQVQQALAADPDHPVPLGRWLQEDLVLLVSEASGNVGRRAARFVGIPESTFRRQLDKARADARAGIAARSSEWQWARDLLARLVDETEEEAGAGLLEWARRLLLEIVSQATGSRHAAGAALMGVTPPTYKRWLTHGVRAA